MYLGMQVRFLLGGTKRPANIRRSEPTTLERIKMAHPTIDARFDKYNKQHPEVYKLLVRFAREVLRRGMKRYSMKTLFERIRWHYDIELQTDEPFKLNNSFTSRYARLISKEHPELGGLFETRRLQAA
jgi:hypothetical protein